MNERYSFVAVRRGIRGSVLLALLCEAGCGVLPERVSFDDPRLKPMFAGMTRVDRRAMGFTAIERAAEIRIEWPTPTFNAIMHLGPKPYDVMLHVAGKTSRTIAFKLTNAGYEWIGEQETFEGPHTYDSVDGTFHEAITITYDRVRISGYPINTVSIRYRGEDPGLASLDDRNLSLQEVRPWLKRWGYN